MLAAASSTALTKPAQSAHTVDGVDFDELTVETEYGPAHLHKGTYSFSDPAITMTLEYIQDGKVAGKTIVVAVFRDELPATGYAEYAQAFEVSAGHAKQLSTIGSFSYYTSGGPFPDLWLYMGFEAGRLYADVWDPEHNCDRKRDWVVSTYTVRNDTLVAVSKLAHHRDRVPLACEGASNPPQRPDEFADLFDSRGQYAMGAAEWTKALAPDPNNSDVLAYRARDYLQLGRFDQAIADYTRAIQHMDQAVGDVRAFFWGRGTAYIYENKTPLALADFDHVVNLRTLPRGFTIDAPDADTLAHRGELFFSLGRFTDAARDLSEAAKLDFEDPQFNANDGPSTFYAPAPSEVLHASAAVYVLLLHLSRSRAGTNDSTEFRNNVSKLGFAKGPGWLVQLFTGKTSDAQTLSAGTQAHERCEASFFVAENELMYKQLSAARAGFHSAEDVCLRLTFERYIARAELARL